LTDRSSGNEGESAALRPNGAAPTDGGPVVRGRGAALPEADAESGMAMPGPNAYAKYSLDGLGTDDPTEEAISLTLAVSAADLRGSSKSSAFLAALCFAMGALAAVAVIVSAVLAAVGRLALYPDYDGAAQAVMTYSTLAFAAAICVMTYVSASRLYAHSLCVRGALAHKDGDGLAKSVALSAKAHKALCVTIVAIAAALAAYLAISLLGGGASDAYGYQYGSMGDSIPRR